MSKIRELLRNVQTVREPIAVCRHSRSQSRLPSPIRQKLGTTHDRGLLATSLQLQFRRSFSIPRHLHQQPLKTYFSTIPQDKKPRFRALRITFKIFHTLWRIFIGYCVFNIFILCFRILPEDLRYRYHKLRGGTDFADQLNTSPVLAGMKKEPGVVFVPYSTSTNFVVVGKEEVRSLSEGEESKEFILTLRPVQWIRRNPGGPPTMAAGGPGDPYERVSKRGPWGVEVENPKGDKKFYAALPTRKEDQSGDLRIEVKREPYDVIGKYISGLRDGDLVMVAGPKRGKTSQQIKVLN